MSQESGRPAASDVPPLGDTTTRRVGHFRNGRQNFHYLHPTTFPTPLLAATLADKWVEVSRERPGGSGELVTGVRFFLRHLGQQLHEVDGLSWLDVGDLRRRHLDAWESDLIARRQSNETDTLYRYALLLFALLDRIERDIPGTLDPEVVERIEQGTRLRHFRPPGLPDFTLGEVRRMRFRAHHLVHRTMHADDSQGPDRETLIALCIMLSLATGEPIEVLRRLSLDMIVATASSEHDEAVRGLSHAARLGYLASHGAVDTFAVTYTKSRAGGETHGNVYTRRDREAHRALTALLHLTAPIRTHTETDCLWISTRADGSVLEPPWSARRWSLRRWLADNNLSVVEPVTWKRFRKVVVTKEASEQGGSYLRRTVRHSPEVFLRDYTTSAVLRRKAGSLLRDTMQEYFEAAVAGPLVVTPEATELLAKGEPTPSLPGDMGIRLIDGELDGPHTACRDPLHSPYQKPGEICRLSTTGTCFGCPNALITQDHLPAALLIAEIADPGRATDPDVWSQHWKHIYEVLTRIVIPAFPSTAVEAARSRIANVPLDTGTANDMRGPDKHV